MKRRSAGQSVGDFVSLVPSPQMPCPYLSTPHRADRADENANGGKSDYHEEHKAVHHAEPIRSSPARRYRASGPLGMSTCEVVCIGW